MLRNSFLLALISSCAYAIKLKIMDDPEYAGSEVPESVLNGPPDGFGTAECGTKAIPEAFDDPICYDGEWIEYAWLDDPTYWACGKKPETKEYSICNLETGVWEDYTRFDDASDAEVCGAVPSGNKYTVCNHETREWEEFHALDVSDFEVCGLKPEHMGFVVCNHDSGVWD